MRALDRAPMGLVVSTTLVAACAANLRAADPWDRVVREAEARTGARPARRPPQDERAAPVSELLADGITRDEAVSIALMNSAELQAAFDELGIAEAAVAEAGLYSNPQLDVLLRIPEGGEGTEAEVELGFSIADLWLVPLRRGLAKARAEQTTMVVVNAVLNAAADAKRAHDACVVAKALREEAERVLEAAAAWRDQVHHRVGFGFSSELDTSMAEAAVGEREIELAEADTGIAVAEARLRRALGLGQGEPVGVVGELPGPRPGHPDTRRLVDAAISHRADLQAARLGLIASGKALTLERRSLWQHVTLGPAYAHEPDGKDLWGGILQVEAPLLDRNQGGRARAAAEARRAANRVQALEASIREQVVTAAEHLRLAMAREQTVREKIMPARQKALDYSTRYYNEMQLNMLYMLEARERLYHAQKEHIAALGEIRAAEVELEFVVGGELSD